MNLHVNIVPIILRKNYYGYDIHTLEYSNETFLSTLPRIDFNGKK